MRNPSTTILYHIIIRPTLNIFLKTLLILQKKKPKLVAKFWLPNLVLYQTDNGGGGGEGTVLWEDRNLQQHRNQGLTNLITSPKHSMIFTITYYVVLYNQCDTIVKSSVHIQQNFQARALGTMRFERSSSLGPENFIWNHAYLHGLN